MGLLDGGLGGLLGAALGDENASGNPMVGAALKVMQSQGGLPGLVSKLQSGGLADQVQSWVGTGANAPVSGGQLASALGPETLTQIASSLGLPHNQVTDGLAKVLPQLVNGMTPQGKVPDNHGDMLTQALGSFLK